MRRHLLGISLILLFFPPLLAALVGWLVAPSFLHPIRRPLTPDLVREADASFNQSGARREDFSVRAPDGTLLRGWKVRAAQPNASWVLLFHGVADNRVGMIGQSEFLLRAGYNVTMMDARAHGESEGAIATYGWIERNDTRAIVDALIATEHPLHMFASGESMGAAIALQSAGIDPRIEAVVAEASFANLREASYDYAGLQRFAWLGKTLFAPGAWTMLYRGQALAGFPIADVSPVHAVRDHTFPVLLICDAADTTLPCRHSEMIYAAARGPKSLWIVPRASHTAALGYEPDEFRRRVSQFFSNLNGKSRFVTANWTLRKGIKLFRGLLFQETRLHGVPTGFPPTWILLDFRVVTKARSKARTLGIGSWVRRCVNLTDKDTGRRDFQFDRMWSWNGVRFVRLRVEPPMFWLPPPNG